MSAGPPKLLRRFGGMFQLGSRTLPGTPPAATFELAPDPLPAKTPYARGAFKYRAYRRRNAPPAGLKT